MRTHLHQQVNNKVSRFIVGEEGKVGSRSAFTAAAFHRCDIAGRHAPRSH